MVHALSDMTPTLAANAFLLGILQALFIAVCVIMILTVLIQRPQGGGLSGAFGSGAGSGQTAFGARTGDALTIATIAMFVIFVGTAVGLNFAARPAVAPRGGDAEQAETAAAATDEEAASDEQTGDPASEGDEPQPDGNDVAEEGEPEPQPTDDDATAPVSGSEETGSDEATPDETETDDG